MRIYFAGAESERFWNILTAQTKNLLISAYNFGYSKAFRTFSNDISLLVDSGGFTARMKNVPVSAKDYAEFINKNGIKLCFNLDTNNVQETLQNQKFLEQNTSAYIIPVYHYSDWITSKNQYLIDKYIAEYPYISLGGMAGMRFSSNNLKLFLSFVFNKTRDKVKVHGLGMTEKTVLSSFPFYSSDSTAWLSAGRYGNSIVHKDAKIRTIRNKTVSPYIRAIDEIKAILKLEKHVTELWTKRGVIWND